MSADEALRRAEEIATREPDDDDETECAHKFRRVGIHHDGTEFHKCRKCGKMEET